MLKLSLSQAAGNHSGETMTITGTEDEKLNLSDEISQIEQEIGNLKPPHKLLIVDDQEDVHAMTRLVLSDYSYDGRGIEFLSAFTLADAKTLIHDHPDASCILLDVVMDTDDDGIELVQFIRETEKNDLLRIILRTGQPGKAPEKKIILNYDINDYKEKTELTAQKLFTSITSALRSYHHLVELEKKRKEVLAKNDRLNEEIARRIVAEHNLTKYNRSLEKLLESKSEELKQSLDRLGKKEKELHRAYKLAAIGSVSQATLSQFELPGKDLDQNLEKMEKYRGQITALLGKYEILKEMIHTQVIGSDVLFENTKESLEDLESFKRHIDIESILTQYPKIIEDSSKGIEQISTAIQDIQDFIAIGREAATFLNINSHLETAIQMAGKVEGVDLQLYFEDLPEIEVPSQGLCNAFYEIIKNAFEAVGKKGIVSISTELSEDAEKRVIQIHISDIGCGIDPEILGKIFTPYFSTKNKKGLGLTLARSVIRNCGGEISITSHISQGTNVLITLPISAPEP